MNPYQERLDSLCYTDHVVSFKKTCKYAATVKFLAREETLTLERAVNSNLEGFDSECYTYLSPYVVNVGDTVIVMTKPSLRNNGGHASFAKVVALIPLDVAGRDLKVMSGTTGYILSVLPDNLVISLCHPLHRLKERALAEEKAAKKSEAERNLLKAVAEARNDINVAMRGDPKVESALIAFVAAGGRVSDFAMKHNLRY